MLSTATGTNEEAPGKPAIWLIRLDHLVRETDRTEELAHFYCEALAMQSAQTDADQWMLGGFQRQLLIQRGARGQQPPNAFRVSDARLVSSGSAPQIQMRAHTPGKLRGRLQHVLVATNDLPAITDNLVEPGKVTGAQAQAGPVGQTSASFYRSDPDHHSFAAFCAPQIRPDHLSLEADDCYSICDWAHEERTLNLWGNAWKRS